MAVKKRRRLSLDNWLDLAIEAIARNGKAQIEIDTLANNLGVTKGSFYSHFRDKTHFIHTIAVYWLGTRALLAVKEAANSKQTAEAKLLSYVQSMKHYKQERYDIIMRTWALDDAFVSEQVEKVDLARYDFVNSLFQEMGFDGDDLEMRSILFLSFHNTSLSLKGRLFEKNLLKQEQEFLRHRLLTQKFDDQPG